MSTATQPPSPVGPADALAASRRVQQLQALLAQAREGSTSDFAAALEAAAHPSAQAGTAPSTPLTPGSADALEPGAAAPSMGSPLPAGATLPAGAPLPAGASLPAMLPAGATAGATLPSGAPLSAAAGTAPGAGGTPYDALVAQSAARYGIDPALLDGLIQQESGFDPSSRSSAGALGLTQLMPGTAASLGVRDPLNPAESIDGGARYLSEMLRRFGGNTADALAAYNAGPGAVQQYGGVPPYAETQHYVSKVLDYANAYRQSHGSPASTGPLAPASGAPPGGASIESALEDEPARTATAEGHRQDQPNGAAESALAAAFGSAHAGAAGGADAGARQNTGTAVSGDDADRTGTAGLRGLAGTAGTTGPPAAASLTGTAGSTDAADASQSAGSAPASAPGAAPASLNPHGSASTAPQNHPSSQPTGPTLDGTSGSGVPPAAQTPGASAAVSVRAAAAAQGSGAARHGGLAVPLPAPSATQAPGAGAPAPLATLAPSTPVSAAPAGPQAPLLGYGVGLQQAIEAVQATIELARSQGLSQARIALAPAELGEIRIHLSQTAEGLLARVTANTPAAAQALAGSRLELHQSLHSLGLAELRMDLGSFQEPGAQGRADQPATHPLASARGGRLADTGDGDIDAPQAPAEPAPLHIALAGSALIDVLA
jgi:soluble lytic murein transglycosylase-like protein